MPDQAPRVSLVIPCRNEAVRLPPTLRTLNQYLDECGTSAEIVVVDDKSTDATIAEAERHGAPRVRVVANPVGRGKGYAVRTGMLAASGEIIFFMDADLSVPARFVGEFLREFDGTADVVYGSRRHRQSVIATPQPWLRDVCGRIFNAGLKFCGATRSNDTQCGFKAFRRSAAREVFSRVTLDGFGFDVEALAIAEVLGLRVVEAPVEWHDAPGSKVRALRDGVRSFFEAVLAARRARGRVRAEGRS